MALVGRDDHTGATTHPLRSGKSWCQDQSLVRPGRAGRRRSAGRLETFGSSVHGGSPARHLHNAWTTYSREGNTASRNFPGIYVRAPTMTRTLRTTLVRRLSAAIRLSSSHAVLLTCSLGLSRLCSHEYRLVEDVIQAPDLLKADLCHQGKQVFRGDGVVPRPHDLRPGYPGRHIVLNEVH